MNEITIEYGKKIIKDKQYVNIKFFSEKDHLPTLKELYK